MQLPGSEPLGLEHPPDQEAASRSVESFKSDADYSSSYARYKRNKYKDYGSNPKNVSVTELFERFCMDDRYRPSPEGMFRNRRLKGTSQGTSLSDQSMTSSNMSVFERGKSAGSSKDDPEDILTRDSVLALCRKYCAEESTPETGNEDSASRCESPDSELASTTTQLLFVDPRSDRTSLADLYEPCLSIGSKRPSIKRQWNFSSLDLRLIDEDTPTTCSPDPLESECPTLEIEPEPEPEIPPPLPCLPVVLPPDKKPEKEVTEAKRTSIAKMQHQKRSKCFPL